MSLDSLLFIFQIAIMTSHNNALVSDMPVLKIIGLFLSLSAALGGYVAYQTTTSSELIVQGEVEATRIDLAAKISGRVSRVHGDFGDRVEKGRILVELSSPQLEATLLSAKASLDVASANRDLVFSTRPEVIAARKAELAGAEANQVLAEKTHARIERLRESATASAQRLDEASNNLTAARRRVEQAQANLELARNGRSAEERAVSQAMVTQAQASVAKIRADLNELIVHAPLSGQITARLAEPGELFSAGAMLMSIVDIDNAWFTFNLREDLLRGLAVDQILQVRVPALDDQIIPARVTAINVEGSYANWRATKATGDFDLRTFSVRAQPVNPVAGLRPGMSALVEWTVR